MKTNLLMSLSGCIATSAGVFATTMEVQQGQPGSAPGGTPSKQPAPKSPTPPPSNPAPPAQPQPSQPQPAPTQPAPTQPAPTQPAPSQPGDKLPADQTPLERQPGQPTPLDRKGNRTPVNRQPGASTDNPRFVSLADPSMEPRFRESATRLASLERAMAQRNQKLVERLGALRQLPAERQNGATLDLLQDILQENAQLQQYLSQSRTLITGDLVDPTDPQQNAGANQQRGTQPNQSQPSANSPGTPQPASNSPR